MGGLLEHRLEGWLIFHSLLLKKKCFKLYIIHPCDSVMGIHLQNSNRHPREYFQFTSLELRNTFFPKSKRSKWLFSKRQVMEWQPRWDPRLHLYVISMGRHSKLLPSKGNTHSSSRPRLREPQQMLCPAGEEGPWAKMPGEERMSRDTCDLAVQLGSESSAQDRAHATSQGLDGEGLKTGRLQQFATHIKFKSQEMSH